MGAKRPGVKVLGAKRLGEEMVWGGGGGGGGETSDIHVTHARHIYMAEK